MTDTTTAHDYDALVIGAGAGGLCAAALLSHHGYRTLVVEAHDRPGGRAGSVEEDGCVVNTGAIAIEYGGILEEVFRTVGAPFDIRVPDPATMFRIKGKDVDISRGGWGKLVNGVTKKGASLLDGLGQARRGEYPEEEMTTEQWLLRYTKNDTMHAIFRNLCAAIFAVNADELPAKAFLTYFIEKGAFKAYGFSPTGTGGLMQGLADAVVARGGDVWYSSSVTAIKVTDGRVVAADVERGGRLERIEPRFVVSNVGPSATAALVGREHLDADYLDQLDRDLRPTANIVVNIASSEPLMDVPGILTFGLTRRLCNMGNLTATCPELAPDGRHLYVAYGVPRPAVGDFEEQAEIAATLADLHDEFENFDEDEVLSIRVMKGEWPAQRSVAGFDLPRETTLPNLWNVGDGVRTYANGGVQACAETGKLVVDAILALDARSPAIT
ncbi:phytoene desaturase family protein [Nitriliruptor alkaliphilus]|uniref:phytoene desaturase family protein n=1 Tax=Nitriliruptor alkaliphilus TaxID=427918 RepID=UPI000697B718|nr:FAD-dependent oxidoreductase [Nitriliruptor alkaliphilus]